MGGIKSPKNERRMRKGRGGGERVTRGKRKLKMGRKKRVRKVNTRVFLQRIPSACSSR